MKTKKIYQSKTIIGAVITIIAVLFPQIVTEVELSEVVTLSTALFGILLTVYGRIVADKKIIK